MTTSSQEQSSKPTAPKRSPSQPARAVVLEPMLLATTDARALVRFFHDKVKLKDREIATAMGTGAGTVRRWRSAKATHAPRDVRALDDMRVIVALLVNSGALSLDEAGGFLRSRVVPPNDEIPLELFAAGEDGFRRVREVAQAFVDALLLRPPVRTSRSHVPVI